MGERRKEARYIYKYEMKSTFSEDISSPFFTTKTFCYTSLA